MNPNFPKLTTFLATGSLTLALAGCGAKSKRTAAEPPRLLNPQEVPAGENTPKQELPAEEPKAPAQTVTDKNPSEAPVPTPGGTTTPPIPEGMPTAGTVFNVPIGPGTMQVGVGRFWNVLLPPRYHLLSYATNKTFEGPDAVEYGQVMDDPLTRTPFCDSGASENGGIITVPDGTGVPHSYCVRYFNSEVEYRVVAGAGRGLNHVEFSSPAQDPATYERFYFATTERRDPEQTGSAPLTRFDAFCSASYNRGAITMDIINNWWNDPLAPRPVRVKWCQTQVGGGFGGPLDVWVAGFFFEENEGANHNAARATVEMTFVASAAGIPTAFRPDVFLRGAAFRVRAMLVQTGLNAPFNNYTP